MQQYSTDHRGTTESPGRVVTVIERGFWETLDDPHATLDPNSTKVWGAAYHIPASHAEEVHHYLDIREIDGYTVHFTPFHPISTISTKTASKTPEPEPKPGSESDDSSSIVCMVYIGQPSNPQFLRDPARRDPQDVAQVISSSSGLSGKNSEYLFLLEKALESIGLGTADVHVTDLVRRVQAIQLGQAEVEEKEAESIVKKSLMQSSPKT